MAKGWKKEYAGDMLHQWKSDCGDFLIRENYAESETKYSLFIHDRFYCDGNNLAELKQIAEEYA